jgi:hypothetical protein
MTETQRRQYIADEINAKIATNTTVEQLAFLAEAFTQLEKTGLTLVYGTEELAIKLNNAIIAAAQAPTATGRDIRLAEKYSKNLLNTPPVDGDYAAAMMALLSFIASSSVPYTRVSPVFSSCVNASAKNANCSTVVLVAIFALISSAIYCRLCVSVIFLSL